MINTEVGQLLLLKQVGKPYKFGYEVKLDDPNPLAFDCSELVQWFFHQMGLTVPDGSYNQFIESQPIQDQKQPLPFDVGFLLKNQKTPFHVFMCFDSDTIIHAKGEKFGVVRESMAYVTKNVKLFSGWRQLITTGGKNA